MDAPSYTHLRTHFVHTLFYVICRTHVLLHTHTHTHTHTCPTHILHVSVTHTHTYTGGVRDLHGLSPGAVTGHLPPQRQRSFHGRPAAKAGDRVRLWGVGGGGEAGAAAEAPRVVRREKGRDGKRREEKGREEKGREERGTTRCILLHVLLSFFLSFLSFFLSFSPSYSPSSSPPSSSPSSPSSSPSLLLPLLLPQKVPRRERLAARVRAVLFEKVPRAKTLPPFYGGRNGEREHEPPGGGEHDPSVSPGRQGTWFI